MRIRVQERIFGDEEEVIKGITNVNNINSFTFLYCLPNIRVIRLRGLQ
jgi:hypothetical protein